jgi:hypothetical protein
MPLDLTPDEVKELARQAKQVLDRRQLENKLKQYAPYPKQRAFHDAGRDHRERLLRMPCRDRH